ncbi:MAG TPA: hypothetical protein VHZ54_14785 [Solirubrobacterales bacterium]|jgi:hypothetical protein|nr:hypothetical protein [Solirubrobacterales bacterium]
MSQDCPPISDLLGGEPAAIEHARDCERCRALLGLGQRSEHDFQPADPPRFARATIPERHPLTARAVGEVVTVRGGERVDGELLLAALLSISEDSLEVAPLCGDVTLASEWDLLLDSDDGPLGYEVMAEVWNHGRVSPGQVAESLGVLSEQTSEDLLALYAAAFSGESPVDARTGPPLLSEEDPRSLFQDQEAERARSYWSGAEETREEVRQAKDRGIGVLLGAWLVEVGEDPAGLATQAGWMQRDVEHLLRDEIDRRQSAFAAARMAELLAHTTIEPEDVRLHLHATLSAAEQMGSTPVAARVYLARPVLHRAPASVEKRLEAKREEGAGDLDAYLDEVVAMLEELRD